MKNLDNKIREKLQKDQFISKNAERIFDDFSTEYIREKEQTYEKNRFNIKYKIGKIIATITCIATLLGGANVYALTHGYGNIFFLIKYMVTGEKPEITDKNELLSDRDITISYEPITLTENIRMQIRNLQIKDNKAVLRLEINETKDSNITPLKYKIYNSLGILLCDQNSTKEGNKNGYSEEIRFTGLTKNDNIIKLEVYTSYNTNLTKIEINLNTREVIVQGEEEALEKISEIEFKEFLKKTLEKENSIKKEEAIINIKRMSYCAGLYTANVSYSFVNSNNTFNIDYNKLSVSDATICFTLNENNNQTGKYTVIKFTKE